VKRIAKRSLPQRQLMTSCPVASLPLYALVDNGACALLLVNVAGSSVAARSSDDCQLCFSFLLARADPAGIDIARCYRFGTASLATDDGASLALPTLQLLQPAFDGFDTGCVPCPHCCSPHRAWHAK
jgi:hypothetical protein